MSAEPTREPQGTSSSLSSPPKHKKTRIKCGTKRYNKAFSLPSDRITPFPTQACEPRRMSAEPTREPQGTSSSLSSPPKPENPAFYAGFSGFGGEDRIRTCGTLPYTTFPMLHHRPLRHLSKKVDFALSAYILYKMPPALST